MPDRNPNDSDNNPGGRRLPRWAGYLLIAADVIRLPLFLLCWLTTLAALSMALPADSVWIWLAVMVLASIATLAAVTRAAATQASADGALGAYVARLATTTSLGRCLTDFLDGSNRR